MTAGKAVRRSVLTPEFRAAFLNVFNPRADMQGKMKYSVTMLFDKSDDIKVLKDAVIAVRREKWGADKTKWPRNLQLPFKDGDEMADLEGFPGHIAVRCSANQAPGVVGKKAGVALKDDGTFFSGCYARAYVVVAPYEAKNDSGAVMKRGITMYLENIQMTREGDSFMGRKKPEDVFDDIDSGENDASNYEDGGDDDGLGV